MSAKSVEETYKKMSQIEHIMARPDMYIGSQQRLNEEAWVFDEEINQMKQMQLSWIPGLYKIYDEIIVNAADNKIRSSKQTDIKIDINKEEGKIRVWNNGEGIPVVMHKEHKLWIPELIFGHLLTSSNYDDAEAKITGGRNGFGAKLTNVFSKRFEIRTFHKKSKKKFKMQWRNNMTVASEPIITPHTEGEDYTEVTFWPDFEKFGMNGLEEDVVLLMKRRAYDLAGTTAKTLKVTLNEKVLDHVNFQQYVNLYPMMGEVQKSTSFSRINDRWEVCVRPSNKGFQQMSFVNSIATTRGGKHVDYIVNQIIESVISQAKKKRKGVDPKPYMIRPHLWVFINCLIENPSFDSQTKELLENSPKQFGSTCNLPNSMIDYILKSGIVERTIETADSKLTKQMAAKIKSADRSRVTGIPKLDDANDAGTKYSQYCTLILTEGDSAKTLAVSGLGTVGRDRFGVFPLRGKPLNVRDCSMKKVADCEEIQAILKIIGLKVGTTYTSVTSLRYGQIMIMADQDHDGSHIKGLLINMIHHFWPSLIEIPGFITQFITPIVKAKPQRGSDQIQTFYSLPDFLKWKEKIPGSVQKQFHIIYYKGLGTSTAQEAREYFQAIDRHRIQFFKESTLDDERIVMAFSKDKIDERKKWITNYHSNQTDSVDFRKNSMRYKDFIDKELILFSVADCERSIPQVVDGLKPGQRKIVYSGFKRNLIRAIKVAQFAGYVSENAAYHHGEMSLTLTMVGMAQDFVGSNNLPLFEGKGQFGTRLGGGKDAASARYIFIVFQKYTRALFHPIDDYILDYKDDDGFPVEPHMYLPIIPIVLVNGCSGIGTGFSTKIPSFSPLTIIENLRLMIKSNNPVNTSNLLPMIPWYHGFKGSVQEIDTGKYLSKGIYVVNDGIITITELPIDTWTNSYKKFLDQLVTDEVILNFREYHTDISVEFDIAVHPTILQHWRQWGLIEEKLELTSLIHASNIICFDSTHKLCKYANAIEVLKEFYQVRYDGYIKRKKFMIREIEQQCLKLQNMVRFINEVITKCLSHKQKEKSCFVGRAKTA